MKIRNTGSKINGFKGVVLMPDAEVEVTSDIVVCPAVSHQIDDGTFTLILENGETDPREGYKGEESKDVLNNVAKIIMPKESYEEEATPEEEHEEKKSKRSKKTQ